MRSAGSGHQGRTIGELIERSRSASIRVPRENRKRGAASEDILARYRGHLARTPCVLAERAALLCYEAAAKECHRSVLLEALAALRPEFEPDGSSD